MKNSYTIKLDESLIKEKRRLVPGHLQLTLTGGGTPELSKRENDVLTDFLAVYEALYETLSKTVNGAYAASVKRPFLSMYAVNVAAAYVQRAHALPANGEGVYASGRFSEQQLLQERWRGAFSDQVKQYLASRDEGDGERLLAGLIGAFASNARNASKAAAYEEIGETVGAFGIVIGKETFGNSETVSLEKRVEQTKVELANNEEIVIGNEALKSVLRQSLALLADYKAERKNGPRLSELTETPRTINAYGPPGTGKTSTIRSVYQWAKRVLEPGMSVPLELLQISNKQKSKFFSESGKTFEAVFEEMKQGEKAYLLVIDDVDMVVHSRDNTENSTEEQNILETLMRRLDGLGERLPENVILVTTSNRPMNVDRGLDSRIAEYAVATPGPENAAETGAILKLKLEKAFANKYASFNVETVGAALYDQGLAGRDIKGVARRVQASFNRRATKHGELPFTAATIQAAIKSGVCIGEQDVLEALDEYLVEGRGKEALQDEAEVGKIVRRHRLEALALERLQSTAPAPRRPVRPKKQ